MLDNILNLVRENAGDSIVNNNAIPNQFNNDVMNDTAGSIFNGLKNQVSSGGMSDIMNMFQGGGSSLTSNPVISNIISSVAGNMTSKYGVSQADANSSASSIVNTVMQKLVSKTNDPSDSSFDLQGIMSSLGGSGFDLGGLLGGNNKSSSSGVGGMLDKLF